jgi:hypothetical protein
MQPARVSRFVMNREQAHLVAANHRINAILAHIGKSNEVRQNVLRPAPENSPAIRLK